MRCTKDELQRLYIDDKLTGYEIATKLNIPAPTVFWSLKKYGIPCKVGGGRKGEHYSPETEFRNGLVPWNKGKTKDTDHRIVTGNSHPSWNKGLTRETDTRLMAMADKIKGGTHHDAKYALGKEFYLELYWGKGLNLQAIADKLGCDATTVFYYFKKYKIPRRIAFEAIRRKPTAPELKLAALMEKHKLPYRYVGNGAVWFEGYNPDFINVNGAKGIIELFGDYWHTSKIKDWRETESGKQYHFARFGFKTLILWENELRDENVVVKKIKTFTLGLKGVV